MAVAASENFADLLDPRFRKIFTKEWLDYKSMLPFLFKEETSGRSQEKYSGVTGLGDWNEFTGTINYDVHYQGYDKTLTPVEKASGFKIERKLWDDDQFSVMDDRVEDLAYSGRVTQEKDGASIFNNAFDSSYTGGDAKSLCNSGHTSTVSGQSTQSNTGTTAISATEIEVVRRAMIAYKTLEGNYVNAYPDTLVVATAGEEVAWEVIESAGKVDTANNNRNYHEGKYKLVVWHNYLSDGNNWFMTDSRLMKRYLIWLKRIEIEFNRDIDFNTYIKKWSGYMRYTMGFTNWTWIYGENVS